MAKKWTIGGGSVNFYHLIVPNLTEISLVKRKKKVFHSLGIANEEAIKGQKIDAYNYLKQF